MHRKNQMETEFTIKNEAAMTDTNDVIFSGVIVHKFVTPKIAILTVNTGKATPVVNYPKILFFGDLREQVEHSYEVKDHVTIKGNIQSTKRKPGVVNQAPQAVFGEEIELTNSIMKQSFNIEGPHSYKPFENNFKISGVVVAIECSSPRVVKLIVKTVKNKRTSFVQLIYHTQDSTKLLGRVRPGDRICALGCVQTKKQEKGDAVMHYENCIILEIQTIGTRKAEKPTA